MIPVSEAIKIVESVRADLPSEVINIKDAMGRVLMEDWFLDRDMPPYDRVTMDGVAFRHAVFQEGHRFFEIESIAAAGAPQKTLQDPSKCIEVMTGAMMPKNADVVIRYEDITITDGVATIDLNLVRPYQNIHTQGSDQLKGTLIVGHGTLLSAAELGIGYSIGKEWVKVVKRPRVMVVSTGDELVDVSVKPLAHQIRKSNVHQIKLTLESWNLVPSIAHLQDDKVAISESLGRCLKEYDAIILSGGVSKGKFDFIPEVLESLGVDKGFHKVKQRPGKPFWFGKTASCTVFGLPGNPISSFMCTHMYVRLWLNASLGTQAITEKAKCYGILTEDILFKPDLTYFALVSSAINREGQCVIAPTRSNGSGDMTSLLHANAFVILPQNKNLYKAGEIYEIINFRI